ncbi:hypothetical protein ACHAXT_012990 [Thalassiosira profunda]
MPPNAPPPSAASAEAPAPFALRGRILRKKNISPKCGPKYLKLAVLGEDDEWSSDVFVPRPTDAVCAPSEFGFLYVDSVVYVQGRFNINERGVTYRRVEKCELVKCAPAVKLIQEVLALPDYCRYAKYLNMEAEELQSLIENSKSKDAVNAIIERITGRPVKSPRKYRPGPVRGEDREALERKEMEGQSNESWKLCQPCRSLHDDIKEASSCDPMSAWDPMSVTLNLPNGSQHSISAHGKLTRVEYLLSKKNRQVSWFVSRIRQFDQTPRRFLDVGGGRGDLAVQLAVHFPEAQVVVVDCNESSVEAGKEYAAKCRVENRIEFITQNFAEYVETYDASSERVNVDCVVALHACGDLSDLALHFASLHDVASFVICPCCYPKRYLAPFVPHWHTLCEEKEINSLSRLVELDDHREVSHRAMAVINSMRKSEFGQESVGLEEYEESISKRNVVLVGSR